MNRIDRLERADHDLEVNDLAFVIPLDHVDAIDGNAVNLGLKFQYRVVTINAFCCTIFALG